jgi:hypothetical protein
MREIGLVLGVLLTVNTCYASGVGMSGPELLYNFKLLIGIGLFGVIGSSLLSLFGNGKIAGLILKVSYFAGFIVFLSIATVMFDAFVTIYQKIEKLMG